VNPARTNSRRLRTSGASVLAIGAFVVPIAFASNAAAAADDSTTTTVTAPTSSTSTSSPNDTTTSTTSNPTASSTTSTTGVPTSTTASPPVTEQGVVVVGANGNTIHAEGAIDAQATGDVLAQTGSSTMPVWLTGATLLVSGALALTFNRRRHLNPYVLRSSRRS
jgi:LPXTG-motif cell wall-anchored protein